jgi:hypothetical protein
MLQYMLTKVLHETLFFFGESLTPKSGGRKISREECDKGKVLHAAITVNTSKDQKVAKVVHGAKGCQPSGQNIKELVDFISANRRFIFPPRGSSVFNG